MDAQPHPSRRGETGRHFWLGAVVVAWGLQAIVIQSLLLRESLVLMSGSELAWGVVLGVWLAGVAGGGALGGHLSRKAIRLDTLLILALLALSVLGCLEIWGFRHARGWIGLGAGEFPPLPMIGLAALALIAPAGGLIGLAFPLACCLIRPRPRENPHAPESLARIYGLESIGSLIGGAAFSFWAVEHLSPIASALTCGALTATAGAALLACNRRRRAGAFLAAMAAGGFIALLLLERTALNDHLVVLRWRDLAPGYELVAETESRYQNLALGRRADQFTLYGDGQITASFPDPYTVAPYAHLWMCEHPQPRRVLLIGGGVEGLLAEILLHPVERVDVVSPDPRELELVAPFLANRDRRALADPRVRVIHEDARYFIKTRQSGYELAIARLPEPTSAFRARFYTRQFYEELRRAMTDRAVLCMTAAASPAGLSEGSAEYLASIRATLAPLFPEIIVGWGEPAPILASTEKGLLTIDPEELIRRFRERKVTSEFFDPLWFEGSVDWFEPEKIAERSAELDAVPGQVSTDLRPAIYMARLTLWEQMTSPATGATLERLQSASLLVVCVALLLTGAILLGGYRLRAGPTDGWCRGAIIVSVISTAFTTMSLSIVLLFTFQNFYGYVYQRIGWIVALFMAGLVLGCQVSRRHLRDRGSTTDHLWQSLIGVDGLLAGLAFLIPLLLPALGAMQTTPFALWIVELTVSAMVLTAGVLGGASFALAGGLQLTLQPHPGRAAGSIVWADHAGGCAGAICTGILLVPVFGIPATAFLLGGMKLISIAALLFGRHIHRGHAPASESFTQPMV